MKINLLKLDELVDQKYLSRQKHWSEDLYIYNYTHTTQKKGYWTPETIMCRGLIVDFKGNIKARPFPKFWNLSEHESEDKPDIPNEGFDVYEKLDGSLGILYYGENNMPYIATRGSFKSEQAIEATKILREKYFDVQFIPEHTYLFEIIYPQNRIVVDYGDVRDLCLLAVIDNKTGKDLPMSSIWYAHDKKAKGPQKSFLKPKQYEFNSLEEIVEMAEKKDQNDEGFVIRFKSGMRVKVKLDEYVRLHRLLTGVTTKRVWDILRHSENIDELIDRVPEEFEKWIVERKDRLEKQYAKVEKEALSEFSSILNKMNVENSQQSLYDVKINMRAEFAELAKKAKHKQLMFAILDNRDYKKLIWKQLKPKPEKPFYNDTENI